MKKIYREFQPNFWDNPKIIDEFNFEEKYLYVYLLTIPIHHLCGCFEFSIQEIVLQTDFTKDKILELLDALSSKHKVIEYDLDTKEILILNWYKYNWKDHDNVLVGIVDEVFSIKNKNFRIYLTNKLFEERKYTVLRLLSNANNVLPNDDIKFKRQISEILNLAKEADISIEEFINSFNNNNNNDASTEENSGWLELLSTLR